MEQLKKFLNVEARNKERGRRGTTSSSGSRGSVERKPSVRSVDAGSGGGGGGGKGKAHNERIKASGPDEKDDEESQMKDGLGKWVTGREASAGGKRGR
jgi:hypothetical protein